MQPIITGKGVIMEISLSRSSITIKAASPNPAKAEETSSQRNSTIDSSSSNESGPRIRDNAETARQLRNLQSRDRAVRAHEQAHLAVAGHYATSGANLEYRKGTDGRSYAVAGEVSIDTAPVSGDPTATIRKAEVIRRAALAPSNPSAQDRRVAAEAGRMAMEARLELQREGKASQAASRLDQHLTRAGMDDSAETPALTDLLA